VKFLGVDGCRRGWVAAVTDGRSSWEIDVFESISSLWARHKNAALILVDIPIGLPFRKRRECDVGARRLLGPKRSSSVFPAPCRAAAYAANFEAAMSANRQILSGALSLQTWGICKRICDVDGLLTSNRNATKIIRESHPEVCFRALAGGRSMEHPKKTNEGLAERLAVVQGINGECRKVYEEALAKCKRKDVARDDVLDAIVLALTAGIRGELTRIPAEVEKDEKGLVMEIVYKRRNAEQGHEADEEWIPGQGASDLR
jgi:predicted RNase H-like nuclease